MRRIKYSEIVEAVSRLCVEACYELGEDVVSALERAAEVERSERGKGVLGQLLENAKIAREDKLPLCQDTGLAVVFLEMGSGVLIEGVGGAEASVVDAVNEGVLKGYGEGYLRKSVVGEPLKERKNTGTNTPAVVHVEVTDGEELKISLMSKGGGCENKSQFRMFNPTAESGEVVGWVVEVAREAGANACPPFVIGVGIGGDFEQCCYLSKKSLLRSLGESHADEFYAGLEREIVAKVNSLGIGPLGFGGDITVLGCMIEHGPCHIASLPVAVNIECHSHRHKSVTL